MQHSASHAVTNIASSEKDGQKCVDDVVVGKIMASRLYGYNTDVFNFPTFLGN